MAERKLAFVRQDTQNRPYPAQLSKYNAYQLPWSPDQERHDGGFAAFAAGAAGARRMDAVAITVILLILLCGTLLLAHGVQLLALDLDLLTPELLVSHAPKPGLARLIGVPGVDVVAAHQPIFWQRVPASLPPMLKIVTGHVPAGVVQVPEH
jgi:hypothetical protein